MKRIFLNILLLLLSANHCVADEIRMAYLELKENKKDNFSIIFKIPSKAGRKLNLTAKLPSTCKEISQIKTQLVNNAYLNSWEIECDGTILGSKISITGLKETNTNLLLHLEFIEGVSQTKVLTPENQSYEVPGTNSSLQIAGTYTFLGIEHILEGFDHLLFVFALLLIAKSMRQLVLTITAFTLAHSITLAGVTFGYLKLPQQPIEAIIALSIIFLAMEIVHKKRGIDGIASRFPWIVSFTFGLLHGFGFAGALAEIGLPQQSVPLALLFFNVGVETGQLIFVTVVVLIGIILKKITRPLLLERARTLTVYGIGSLASFWFIERVSAF
jgi:hydrogenase/urease accessory protein HupE